MRQLASYSLSAPCSETANRNRLLEVIDDWLREKGSMVEDGSALILADGLRARIDRSVTNSGIGTIDRVSLTQPIENGSFLTAIEVAENADLVALSVQLAAESTKLAPQWLDVRRPKVILRTFEAFPRWRFRGTELTATPLSFRGSDGGDRFVGIVWSETRSVPVIAISTDCGLELHPGIASGIASDLAGLAIVAQIDEEAAWRLT